MDRVFDAMTPADGVRVCPAPRPKVAGLSLGQSNGLRRLTLNGHVLGAKPVCIPTGLGMMSTVRSAAGIGKHIERPRTGDATRSLCHRARADGRNMEKAADRKIQQRIAIKHDREGKKLLRRAMRAMKYRFGNPQFNRLAERLRKTSKVHYEQLLHAYRCSSGEAAAA